MHHNIGGKERKERLNTPDAQSVEALPHRLDVLLRNKRSPRLQGWFERDVLPESLELTNQAPR
jgi:hypothetical protein